MARSGFPLHTRAGLFALHATGKLASLSLGAAYVSRPVDWLRTRLDGGRARPVFSGRVALVAHVFYPDLLPEILARWDAFPEGTGLIVTVPVDRAESIKSEAGPGLTVVPVINRGRDILPFIGLLNSGALDAYDVVLKLHTKRSKHLLDGEIRRKLLYTALAGSRKRVQAVLRLFEDPRTGVVGWGPSWRRHPIWWMGDRPVVAGLASRLGIEMPVAPSFFEGSMFWVRVAALRRLRALGLGPEDFEVEAGQTDGMLHHGLERTFCLAAAADGFATRDLWGRVLLAGTVPSR